MVGGMGRDFGHLNLGRLGGANALRGDVYIDFTRMADGAPGAAVTGQATLRETTSVDPTTAISTVSSGALTSPASGSSTTGAYTGWQLPEEVQSLYADVSFGDGNDTVALIATGDVHLPPVLASSLHVTFSAGGWTIGHFSAGSLNSDQSGSHTAVDYGRRVRVGWRISGSDIYVLQANGVEAGPYTLSAATTCTNNCAIFEHFRNTTGAPTTKFFRVAANMFATPTAAGRTNLLLNQNNIGGAAWTRTALSGLVSGQADASGGTLADKIFETTASSAHFVLQNVAKAASAKRYTLRTKMKLINRDWIFFNAFDQAFGGQASRYLNLTTQALGTVSGSFTDQTWVLYSLGNGWVEIVSTFKTNTGTAVQPRICTATADGTGSFVGDVTAGYLIYDQWLFERPV